MEHTASVGRRGVVDITLISHIQDAGPRVNEVAALAWADLERVRGNSSRMGLAGEENNSSC